RLLGHHALVDVRCKGKSRRALRMLEEEKVQVGRKARQMVYERLHHGAYPTRAFTNVAAIDADHPGRPPTTFPRSLTPCVAALPHGRRELLTSPAHRKAPSRGDALLPHAHPRP